MSLFLLKCARGCTCISHWQYFLWKNMVQVSLNDILTTLTYTCRCPSPVQVRKQTNMLSVAHSRRLLITNSASMHHIPQVQWWLKGLYKLHSDSMLTAWCHLGLGALVQLLSVLLCACIWTTWGTMMKADILGRSFLWKRERRTPAISYKTQHHLESRLYNYHALVCIIKNK